MRSTSRIGADLWHTRSASRTGGWSMTQCLWDFTSGLFRRSVVASRACTDSKFIAGIGIGIHYLYSTSLTFNHTWEDIHLFCTANPSHFKFQRFFACENIHLWALLYTWFLKIKKKRKEKRNILVGKALAWLVGATKKSTVRDWAAVHTDVDFNIWRLNFLSIIFILSINMSNMLFSPHFCQFAYIILS